MSTKKTVLAVVILPFLLAGCLMYPGPHGRGVVLVPPLPPVVVLDAEPYYVHEGYYYYYRNDGWAYSHARNGPWVDLPRDHYPREVRYRDGGGGRSPGHQGR
jgi:hypothetical protein